MCVREREKEREKLEVNPSSKAVLDIDTAIVRTIDAIQAIRNPSLKN